MRARIVVAVAALSCLAAACDKHKPDAHGAGAARAPTPAPTKTAPPPPAPAPIAAGSSLELDEPAPAPGKPAGGQWIIDDPADIAPAGPASASPLGVVMITRDERALLARFDAAKARVAPIAPDAAFAPYARSPGVLGDFAYFVSKGRLVRARFDPPGALEVLAANAEDGSRVAVAGPAPATAAYIARGAAPGTTEAMLWVEGSGATNLAADGSSPTSVALVRDDGARVMLSLDGRTGMTPVHARRIELAGAKPEPKDDVVVWVAGPSHSTTEIAAVGDKDGVWAFIPLERDITRFGLARLDVGSDPKMGAPVTWRAYPNGLDPAPVAAGRLCGASVVVYALPSNATPHADQELRLAELDHGAPGPGAVLATAHVFASVSLAETAHGGLVAWTADYRTWAESIRCSRTRK